MTRLEHCYYDEIQKLRESNNRLCSACTDALTLLERIANRMGRMTSEYDCETRETRAKIEAALSGVRGSKPKALRHYLSEQIVSLQSQEYELMQKHDASPSEATTGRRDIQDELALRRGGLIALSAMLRAAVSDDPPFRCL